MCEGAAVAIFILKDICLLRCNSFSPSPVEHLMTAALRLHRWWQQIRCRACRQAHLQKYVHDNIFFPLLQQFMSSVYLMINESKDMECYFCWLKKMLSFPSWLTCLWALSLIDMCRPKTWWLLSENRSGCKLCLSFVRKENSPRAV